MLKNLNDYITFITLIGLTCYTIYFFLLSFTSINEDTDNERSRLALFRDYLNNEEE